MMDILIGTKNQYKITEIISLMGNSLNVKIHYWDEINPDIIVEENQTTLKKNAEKKAVEISKHTDWFVLASDGGVDIPALKDRWDIMKNQRIVGENSTDIEKAEKLLDLMKELKKEDRKASYKLAIAIAKKGKLIWSTEKITDRGLISKKLFDQNIPPYRWMGHLWYYPDFKRVFNQLSETEKNEVRKQAKEMKNNLRKAIREISGKK